MRCAPPANKPLPEERDNCLPYAAEELRLIQPAVIVCLGKFAWDAACQLLGIRPRPRFGHVAEHRSEGGPVLLGSYPPEPAEHIHRESSPSRCWTPSSSKREKSPLRVLWSAASRAK